MKEKVVRHGNDLCLSDGLPRPVVRAGLGPHPTTSQLLHVLNHRQSLLRKRTNPLRVEVRAPRALLLAAVRCLFFLQVLALVVDLKQIVSIEVVSIETLKTTSNATTGACRGMQEMRLWGVSVSGASLKQASGVARHCNDRRDSLAWEIELNFLTLSLTQRVCRDPSTTARASPYGEFLSSLMN